MPNGSVLITGGAGFIGTHLVRALSRIGYEVVVLDSLVPQVHSANAQFSPELHRGATCIHGDVRDPSVWDALAAAHRDLEVVVHLAALTGTGQSMYVLREYD